MKFVSYSLTLAALCLTQSSYADSPNNNSRTDRQGVYLAPGWGQLEFKAPAAGSYELPVIDRATDGTVLNSKNEMVRLTELMGEKITILSFIYRTCDDVNGCPLSTMVLNTVASKVIKEPSLKDNLRLLTLSFDPESDTPEAMQKYSESILGNRKIDWHFLTTKSDQQIKPILDAYQQSVVPDILANGKAKKFSHLLRVYLIDRSHQVRNIYSLSFLHSDLLINDIKTLLMEEDAKPVASSMNK
jgi:cytochrome c peroxidase